MGDILKAVSAIFAAIFALLSQPGSAAADARVEIDIARTQIEVGQPLDLDVSVSGAPADVGLVISLRPAETGEASRLTRDVTGPLTREAISVPGDDTFNGTWDARYIACAPSGVPDWCEISPGRYRLAAEIFAGGAPETIADDRSPDRRRLDGDETEILEITGDPDIAALGRWLAPAALAEAAAQLDIASRFDAAPARVGLAEFLTETSAPARSESGAYCMAFDLDDPFDGTIRSCLPSETVSETGLSVDPEAVTVEGRVGHASGVVPITLAAMRVVAHLRDAYADRRVEDQSMTITLRDWAWNTLTPDPAWVIEAGVAIEASGDDAAPDQFMRSVVTRVSPDGRVCRLATETGIVRFDLARIRRAGVCGRD